MVGSQVCPSLLILHQFNGLFSRTTRLDLNETRDHRVLGWQWHQLDHMQTICITSSLNVYKPDALPDAQPKH